VLRKLSGSTWRVAFALAAFVAGFVAGFVAA